MQTKNSKRKKKGVTRAGSGAVFRHPAKYKIGDRVSVPCRFGETGTVKEIKKGRYGVEFHNLDMTLWYDENELNPQTGHGFSWYRTPNASS